MWTLIHLACFNVLLNWLAVGRTREPLTAMRFVTVSSSVHGWLLPGPFGAFAPSEALTLIFFFFLFFFFFFFFFFFCRPPPSSPFSQHL